MKTKSILTLTGLVLSTLNLQLSTAFAQVTAFTYQGRLNSSGSNYTGTAEFQAVVWNAAGGGAAVATNSTGNVIVGVTNGLFVLPLDFGASPFAAGDNRWLELGVRTVIGPFTTLAPRQPLTATPYAILAGNVAPGGGLSGAYSNAVTFNNANNQFNGAFTGNGGGLTNVSAATLGGLSASNFWKTTGNAGTAGVNFLGTTDNQPLELRANNQRMMRLEPASQTFFSGTNIIIYSNAPNVIAGSSVNYVGPGTLGAVIGGGGVGAIYVNNTFSGFISNEVSSLFGTIGGGFANTIQTNALGSTIGGGGSNTIQTNASESAIGGGNLNTIQSSASYSTIGGGEQNTVQMTASYSTIGGGSKNAIRTNATYSMIGGGYQNTIEPSVNEGAIGGGTLNIIENSASYSTIGGGFHNLIQSSSSFSTIGGGDNNRVDPNDSYSTIGGGDQNSTFGPFSTVPGGNFNDAGTNSFAAGHRAKANHTGAFVWADSTEADFATTADNQFLIRASGGVGIGTTAPETDLHVFRGSAGNVTANATAPLVVENDGNTFIHLLSPSNAISGVLFGSPVGSLDASIRYNNSGANRELSFRTLNSQRMVILTNGFVGIATSAPTNTLHVAGGVSATAFVNTSDRNAKENFAPVSPREILDKVAALPITTWNFKSLNDGRHMGPMAQDFYAAFGLGGGDTTITSVDPDGVALAAIQGLNQKLEAARTENADLRQRLERLERLLKSGAAHED